VEGAAVLTLSQATSTELLAVRRQTCENQMQSDASTAPEINRMTESPESSPAGDLVVVNQDLAVPFSELQFRFSRSGGPGGQHVNRSETRVELLFDVQGSPSLTDDQRQRLLQRLRSRLDSDGILHIVASETRSQSENRLRSVTRFQMIVAAALRRRKRRVPTVPSTASREQRLAAKRSRSRIKQTRRDDGSQDYN
jgi:ribosome-associated protein